MTKTADAGTVSTGAQVGFVITATNVGPGIARGTTLTDTLPDKPGLAWVVDPPVSGCAIAGSALSCAFADLAASASRTVHITSPTGAGSAGTIENVASVTATNLPSGCTTCSASATVAVQVSARLPACGFRCSLAGTEPLSPPLHAGTQPDGD